MRPVIGLVQDNPTLGKYMHDPGRAMISDSGRAATGFTAEATASGGGVVVEQPLRTRQTPRTFSMAEPLYIKPMQECNPSDERALIP